MTWGLDQGFKIPGIRVQVECFSLGFRVSGLDTAAWPPTSTSCQ